MTWNVLTPWPLEPAAHEILDEFATVTVADDYDDDDALDDDIHRYDAIVVKGLPLPRDRIERATNLKIITQSGVGLDPVDVQAATEHGVLVCNNPGANTRAVAEYTTAAMLAARKQLRQADQAVRAGTWEKHGYLGPELTHQTMGVFGYGNIGQLVLEFAHHLGMTTIAYDPYVSPEGYADYVTSVDSILELFEQADAVGIHAPLTDETRGAVATRELEALGEDGVVVNAARGGIIDETALVECLRDHVIKGAAVDVFEEEPAPPDHPLFALDNVIVTPHMAGSTYTSVPEKDRGAAENIRIVYDGGIPAPTVNRDEICLYTAFNGTPPSRAQQPKAF